MIGVCIKYFHENYGGMLQAYATVSMLEDRGLDYELIQYEKKWHSDWSAQVTSTPAEWEYLSMISTKHF